MKTERVSGDQVRDAIRLADNAYRRYRRNPTDERRAEWKRLTNAAERLRDRWVLQPPAKEQ